MITLYCTPEDLANMRFAYRPLLEIPFSYRILLNPEFHGAHQRWVEKAQRALFGVELPYLKALVTPDSLYIPHFLTPTPKNNRGTIEDDLEELLATPNDVIRRYTLALIAEDGDSELRCFFVTHPRQAIGYLVEELRMYWERALAHHWSRMISVIEGDILYRGRLLALDGPGLLLADLHPAITYQNNQIQLRSSPQSHHYDREFQLNGDGIQLVPSVFSGERRMQIVPEWHPRLSFPVRGAGGIWNEKPPSQSLELAIGAGRARILEALKTPASTGDLAHKLGVSSGAVSQILSRLTKAGLLQSQRSGKRVYYALTERGENLLDLFETID